MNTTLPVSTNLPVINLNQVLIKKKQERVSWNNDFETNCQPFAKSIAEEFAKTFFSKLQKWSDDKYAAPLSKENKLSYSIELRFPPPKGESEFKKILPNIPKLPPFSEWSEGYTGENVIDKGYFNKLMGIVGPLPEEKLKAIFTQFISKPEHEAYKFEVKWINKDDVVFSNPSDFRKFSLSVNLWYDEKAFSENSEAKEKVVVNGQILEDGSSTSSSLIAKRERKLKEIKCQRYVRAALITIGVIALICALFKSGVVELNFKKDSQN